MTRGDADADDGDDNDGSGGGDDKYVSLRIFFLQWNRQHYIIKDTSCIEYREEKVLHLGNYCDPSTAASCTLLVPLHAVVSACAAFFLVLLYLNFTGVTRSSSRGNAKNCGAFECKGLEQLH